MTRAVVMSPLGLLCNKPPWGEMVAVDLKAGKILWRSRVGTTEDNAPLGIAFHWGTPLVNGLVDHRRRCCLHRRDGCLFARLRRQDRRGVMAGPAAGAGRRQSHDLSVEGRAICRDRRRRSFRVGHDDRRQRGGVSFGAGRRSALAVVAHHRPARRKICSMAIASASWCRCW